MCEACGALWSFVSFLKNAMHKLQRMLVWVRMRQGLSSPLWNGKCLSWNLRNIFWFLYVYLKDLLNGSKGWSRGEWELQCSAWPLCLSCPRKASLYLVALGSISHLPFPFQIFWLKYRRQMCWLDLVPLSVRLFFLCLLIWPSWASKQIAANWLSLCQLTAAQRVGCFSSPSTACRG